MTKRIWLLVAVVSLAIAAGLVLFVFRSEPSYQGRKLTSWIEDLSITVAYWSFDSRGQAIARVGPTRVFINAGSPWGTEEPRTREAIRHIGTNCLPKLVQLIRHQDSPFSLKVLSLLQRQSLLKLKIYSAD